VAELLEQLGRNRRQSRRLGFRFARHKLSLGACYALNTKFLTGPTDVDIPIRKDIKPCGSEQENPAHVVRIAPRFHGVDNDRKSKPKRCASQSTI
ncbi:hypothetical protein, partial [Burkholderia multivorans]|uniref:hypothetical protein n=1 Tax=Burkholderia multivorans TaxID=87883 RepID=UPI001C613E1D